MGLEGDAGEGVDDGVQAAVDEGDGFCQLQGQRYLGARLAVIDDVQALQRVQEQSNVERSPEKEEDDDDDEDHLDRLDLVAVFAFLQVFQYLSVAANEDAKGNQEAQDIGCKLRSNLPGIVTWGVHGDTLQCLLDLQLLAEHDVGYRSQASHQPQDQADNYATSGCPYPHGIDSMDNCYVPIYAHEGYKENTAVKTCVVNASHYLTHGIAKNPLV